MTKERSFKKAYSQELIVIAENDLRRFTNMVKACHLECQKLIQGNLQIKSPD
jgi:hypothetical protein